MAERLSKRWEVSAFDRVNNEWTTTTNHAYEPEVSEDELRAMVVSQAPPLVIKPTKPRVPNREYNLALVIPDIQYPYADTDAMEYVADQAHEHQPDTIIVIGDAVDFAGLSTHQEKNPRQEFAQSTQVCIDGISAYLAQLRCNAPNSEIVLVSGNHEQRLQNYIRKNAGELLGIKRANEELSVLTLEYLLRLGELGVQHVAGYPNGEYWLTDDLKAVHGDTSNSSGSTAVKMLGRHESSVLFGHTHRIEVQYKTVHARHGARTRVAASFGTLALLDGSIPAGRYATDEMGTPVPYTPNWQRGFGWVEYSPTSHHITPIHLTDEALGR